MRTKTHATIEEVIKSHQAGAPENPVIFRRGDRADAEPSVPGWRMAVDEVFGSWSFEATDLHHVTTASVATFDQMREVGTVRCSRPKSI